MQKRLEFTIDQEASMVALGKQLATRLDAPTCILLDGPIGAGKTVLARSIIQSLLIEPEDVPSPTYTLVQQYEGRKFDIWHADLYRLSDSSELVELGLDEALEAALVIIEWPGRLPNDLLPEEVIRISITPNGDTRRVTVDAPSALSGFVSGFLKDA